MSKEAGSLNGPLCAYLMRQNLHDRTCPRSQGNFENDPWKSMDMRVLTGLVCPAARPLGVRQYPGVLKGWGVKIISQHGFRLSLCATRQQAITSIYADTEKCCQMASLGQLITAKYSLYLIWITWEDFKVEWHSTNQFLPISHRKWTPEAMGNANQRRWFTKLNSNHSQW